MVDIVTRAGKGSALTNAEADANFVNLNIGKLEGRAIPIFHADAAALRAVGSGGQIENVMPRLDPADAASNGCWAATNGTTLVAKGVSSTAATIMSSTDGRTFTSRAITIGTTVRPVSDGVGFLAFVVNNTVVNVSAAGTSWAATANALPTAAAASEPYFYASNMVAGTYLVRAQSSTTAAFLTNDSGASPWQAVTLPAAGLKLASAPGLFVAYTENSTTYYTSPTGLTGSWTTRTIPGAANTQARVTTATGTVLYANTAALDSAITRCADGLNWVDTGIKAPRHLSAQNIGIEIGGVGVFSSGVYGILTQHAGKSIARAGSMPGLQNFSGSGQITKHLTGYIFGRGASDGTMNVIDPDAADASLGIFIA